jgi:hypothetical protein
MNRSAFKFAGIIVLSAVLSACSFQSQGNITSPASPISTGPSGGVASLLSLVEGTWVGAQTATVGLSGALTVTFAPPPIADANITGTVTLTLSTGIFHGTFAGTYASFTITATDGPAGTCGYLAHATLNEAGTQITGTYTGTGAGACSTKSGTFELSGQSHVFPPPPPPPPVLDCVIAYFSMSQGNVNAKKNKCENNKGTWLGEFDVPGTPVGVEHDVCKFSPDPPGNPGQDMVLILSTPIVCPVIQ